MKTKLFLLTCALFALASCSKDETEPVPTPAPTPTPDQKGLSCTMAIYGSCGAGKDNNTDIDHVNELIDMLKVGPSEKINVMAQFNFEPSDPSLTYVNGTSVMRLLKKAAIGYINKVNYSGCKSLADSNAARMKAIDAKLKEFADSGAFSFTKLDGQNKVKLYRPSDISTFLDRVAKECPADHYMFCLSGHGGAWDPEDDREITKAVSWDNNFKDTNNYAIGITAKNLAAGINGSSIASKIPIVYFNACSMNFLENICEYAACPVPYALISFKETKGTENNVVLEELMKASGNSVTDLKNAIIAAYIRIYDEYEKICDISLVDIQKMKAAAAGVKDLVPLYKAAYEEDVKYFTDAIRDLNATGNVKSGWDRDFSAFLENLATDTNLEKDLRDVSGKILNDIKASIEKTLYGDKCPVDENLLTGVKFIGKNKYSEWRETYADSFDNNEFYKATGWNKLFEVFDDKIKDKKN